MIAPLTPVRLPLQATTVKWSSVCSPDVSGLFTGCLRPSSPLRVFYFVYRSGTCRRPPIRKPGCCKGLVSDRAVRRYGTERHDRGLSAYTAKARPLDPDVVYRGIIMAVSGAIGARGNDFGVGLPKFAQIVATIASEIHRGQLSGQLPTERELCKQFSVSRATLRRALSALAETGQIQPSWGRGWFVVHEAVSEPPNALLSFSELAEGRRLPPSTKIIDLSTRPADLDEADLLRVAPGSRLLLLERLRFLDNVPIVLQRSLLALARMEGLAEALDSVDLTHLSLYRLLQERWGIVAARADYVVQARAASDREAELLDVAPGSPMLHATQLTFDQEGNPFERHWSCYRGDRYRFEASLSRPGRPSIVGSSTLRDVTVPHKY